MESIKTFSNSQNNKENNNANSLGKPADSKFNKEKSDSDDLNPYGKDVIEEILKDKLKFFFKSENIYSSTIKISQVLNDIKLSLDNSLVKNPELKEKTAQKIIEKMNKYFNKESVVILDSFFPMVKGEDIITFLDIINENYIPAGKKIVENKKYIVAIESFFSKSEISEKIHKLKQGILLLSIINKFYNTYPKYLKNYHEYFIKKYILKEKVELKDIDIENKNNEQELSFNEEYVFIFAINKKIKIFNDNELPSEDISEKKESPDNLIKKRFENEDNNLMEKNNNINIENTYNNCSLIDGYCKEMNNLIFDINKEENCIVKIIDLNNKDLDLNNINDVIMHSCKVWDEIIEKQDKFNKMLADYLSKKFPEKDFSDFI
jgi:hypothetical protein